MGSSSSKPEKTLTDTPWRQPSRFDRALEEKLLSEIRHLSPKAKPTLLMIGPVGAGKSSFINSVCSIGKGRKVKKAQSGSATSSYTTSYDAYMEETILKGYRLRDTMGIEPSYDAGFHVDDFYYLICGHIENHYKFNPNKAVTPQSEYYRPDPSFEDKTHCVVLVVSAKQMNVGISPDHVRKIKRFMTMMRDTQIPRVLILTKADEVCEEVKRNKSLMFSSTAVQRAVKIASEVFQIDQASIHPVVNYETDFLLTTEQNCPLLLAIKQMAEYAADTVEHVLEEDIP